MIFEVTSTDRILLSCLPGTANEDKTSRERPQSALYLRLKILKGGSFGLCETPVGCKI